ncbi:unnamed protein product [Symbiodinium pilosum]|uniref:Uncharacterized protein n=1 Tax=Symbiodinium pilosum TaxID=2952 RepID=A0A812PNL9_SYMPI|nr:unnamed protein product [Symbiodinium pilosum]
MDGYKKIIGIIEESRACLKEARLEQAFEAAIFRGKRRYGQTIAGFLASKKAAFSELKKQGLDLLETDAGNHLLGHLLLKQGGFTNDQQQRIRVLTDGGVDYRKVEIAIRKVFGDTLDETPAKAYWADDWEDEDGGLNLFDDMLEYDPEGGHIYMVLDHDAPENLEETEAIEFMDDYLSWVFYEASKGKSFGHGKVQKDWNRMRYQQGMNLQPPQRHLHHVVLLEGRGQWPQAVGVKKWTRYDNNADCFRVSSSQGPMWSDVTRRRAVDLDTGKVVADEKFTGDERPRMLSRDTLILEFLWTTKLTVALTWTKTGDSLIVDSNEGTMALAGHHGTPQPKSKIGGVWVADCVTPWGDKRKFPVIANARDLQAFSKLVKTDVFYTYSELHSGWICLTK